MTRDLSPIETTAVLSLFATIVAFATGFYLPGLTLDPTVQNYVEAIIRVEVFFSTFNSVLLVVMVSVYVRLYRDLPNKYTVSLLLLGVSLLLFALTAHPLLHVLFGFVPTVSVGPFTFLPDLFVSVAAIVLFYQSQT
jgi:hypothetical protein